MKHEPISIAMSDGTRLAGFFVSPPEHGPHPLVILAPGSGGLSITLDWEQDNFFLYKSITETLVNEGRSVLLLDKRGVGQSEGDWRTQSFFGRAADIRDMALIMKERPDVISERLSIAGHSQGGWIVQLAGALYPQFFSSVLSLAGPACSVTEQIIDDTASRLIQSRAAFLLPLVPVWGSLLKGYYALKRTSYLGRIIAYDARPYLAVLRLPAYYVFAENDALVPVSRNVPLMKALTEAAESSVIITIIPAVNHAFARAGRYESWDTITPKADDAFLEELRRYCQWEARHSCSL
ncbi:alpha/beta hydrolase family protein [Bacillus daqingensis]|uniref:Alpha/beta hydrolase family protein n=1 Tax=Bacillus daqingensis TaxID=872396 RepID=A0ABV9NVC7_9BACI